MTKGLLIGLFCCLGFVSLAQKEKTGNTTTSDYRPGMLWFYSGMRPAEGGKPTKYDRLIFDLVYNDWAGDQGPFENHWASIGLNTSLMFDIPMDKKQTASFGVGLSHQYTPIRHNNRFVADENNSTTTYVMKDSNDVFVSSSLVGNSFSVPVEFRFRSKKWKHFKFHIGGKIGYQIGLHSKQITKVDGHKEVAKRNKYPDQAQLIYSAHMRIGIRNWGLFASYNFNPIFTNKQSTQLNLLQMGLSISLF